MLTLEYKIKGENSKLDLFPLFMSVSVRDSVESIKVEDNTLKLTIETPTHSLTERTIHFLEMKLAFFHPENEFELLNLTYTDDKETVLALHQSMLIEDGVSVGLELHEFNKSAIQFEKKGKKTLSETERGEIVSQIFLFLEKERDKDLEALLD